MDLTEWNIIVTSDQCDYREYVHYWEQKKNKSLDQCSHPDSETRACLKKDCPIKEKEINCGKRKSR